MNRRTILFPIFISLAVVLGVIIGARLNFPNDSEKSTTKHQKLFRLLDILDREYLEGVNTDSIVDLTVQSILSALDPHSTYITADNYLEASDEKHGSFYGIGIRFYTYKDTIAVTEVLPNGPAEKAGIINGDRILSADGRKLHDQNIDRDSLVSILRGKEKSNVLLEVYRKLENEKLAFDVQRNLVPIQSVTASYMLDSELGYIKIEQFTENTDQEFRLALNKLLKEGMASIVLDLRDNAGGYVGQAQRIMEELTPKGTLLYSTKDRSGNEKKYFSKKGRKHDFERIYVLINERSASASEMLAGAIQDNDLGTIVGRRSFGKGLVQVERPLGDGSAVWITVAQYYTPTGRSIQRPYNNGKRAYFAHADSRYLDAKFEDVDKIPDSLRYETPKGKVVYGGGGIYPDVYVAELESKQDVSIQRILSHGFIQFFAFEYIDSHPDLFRGFNKEEFINGYEPTDRLLKEFMEYSHLDRIDVEWGKYQEELSSMLKANLAMQLFGKDAYYRTLSDSDKVIQKTRQLELIAR